MKTARVAAMDFLARREHTRVELQRKLAQKGYAADEINHALDQLTTENLQSDRRFAESFAEQRARRGQGPAKIRYELKQHGVSDTLIDSVLRALAVDWQALAETVRSKKFGGAPQTAEERVKQERFLKQRGFYLDRSTQW